MAITLNGSTGITSAGNITAATDITASGNITAAYLIGNGSQISGVTANAAPGGSNTQIQFNDADTLGGDADLTYNKNTNVLALNGTITALDATVYGAVSAVTGGFSGNVTGANITTGGVVTATGNVRGANLNTAGVVSATGNVTGNYFIGNGSQLTGIVSSYGNANVATYLPTYTGNIGAGNIAFTNNYVYRGNTFTSPETNGILKNFKWEFSDLSSGADTVTLQWNLLDTTFPQWYLTTNSQGNTYVFDGDAKTMGFLDNSINSGTVTFGTAANNGAGSSNDIELTTVTGNAYVRTGSNSWTFGNDGVLTAPGNITTTGNISGGNLFADTNVYVAATNGNLVLGDASATASPGLSSTNSITVTANRAGTPKEWVFTTVGNFVGSGNISGGNISATGNLATSWLDIGNIGNIASLQANVSLQIVANASGSAPYWTFNSDGNLFVPGSINGDNNGPLLIDGVGSGEGYISLPASNFGGEQIAIVNQFSLGNGIALTTNGSTWHFGNSGAFTAPGNITATGNVSGGNIISDGEINSDGRAYVQYVDIRGGYSSGWIGSLGYSGNIVELQGTAGVNIVTTGDEGGPSWQFGTDGTLTAPGDITVSGDITGRAAANTLFLKAQPTTDTYIQLNSIVDSTISIAANLDIVTDSSNTAQTFAFGADGNLFVPGNISANISGYEIGYRNIPQLVFAGDVQVSADDSGKHYYNASNTAYTMSLVDSGAVTYPVGMAVTIVNKGTGNIAVDAFPGVSLYLAGNATAGNRIVTSYGMATVLNVATDVWFISGAGVE